MSALHGTQNLVSISTHGVSPGCMLWEDKNTHACPRVAIISFNGADTVCVCVCRRDRDFLNPTQLLTFPTLYG